MAHRYVSVPTTLSDLERRDMRVTFYRQIYLITLEPLYLAAEHMCGGAHFYGIRHILLQGGQCPSAVQFWGSLLFLRTSFDAELPNLMCFFGLVFRGSTLSQWGRVPSAPQFWGFPYMYAYTLCRRTTKFNAVTHMGSGLVFRRSITVQPQMGVAPVLPILRVFHLWLHSKDERPN